MVGVIDAGDIVRSVSSSGGSPAACEKRASDVMTPEVVSCRTTDSLREVWATMRENRLQHLPATDRTGRAIEVVDARDVLASLCEETEQEEHEMLDYFLSLGFR